MQSDVVNSKTPFLVLRHMVGFLLSGIFDTMCMEETGNAQLCDNILLDFYVVGSA